MFVKSFVFNDFQENTYVVYGAHKSCIIFDPGCNSSSEREQLSGFIKEMALIPKALINTHCHIDHVLGNWFVAENYKLALQAHQEERPVLESCKMVSQMYGISYTESPPIDHFLIPGERLEIDDLGFDILFTPGHSPASISFYNKEHEVLIAGDVLFQRSIGRTDLPGGDFNTLANSIRSQFYVLPDSVVVYPGHGPTTTIGEEKRENPFVSGL